MAYEFHYTPTGTGVISGKEVLEQTEDAINDLSGQISGDVQTAIDTANNALNTANTASADAQNAVNTASTAYTAATNAQNTASNALTAAQNAQNDVNALGNRVTTAEGNITQNTNAITGLTTRMGTAEGNITNLQNDVVTAQATANSAQQTAATARQQAYVLRYSSTAITDNSTIAYSTLDNTDNIKTSDKIIDTDGKIFSIVSVDSDNSTVTVGSALIDLALDANVMHLSGNETVSGIKTFSDNTFIKSLNFTNEVPSPSSSNSSIMPIITTITYGDGSPSVQARLNLRVMADRTKSFYPHENNTYSLGTSSLKWLGCYCENFYGSYVDITGKYIGNEAGPGESSCLYLKSDRDTDGQSGAYIGRFRSDRTQGAMGTQGVSQITFDFLENSTRYTRCFAMGITNWVINGDPQTYYLTSPGGKGSLGTATNAWNKVYANSYYLGTTAFGDIVTHNASEFLTSADILPIGSYIQFAGSQAPAGFLVCNGGAISRTTYSALFAVIGTIYGSGDGSTTFNLPNLTDRFLQGSSTSGTVKNAGLPNITGTTEVHYRYENGNAIGAFLPEEGGGGIQTGSGSKTGSSRSNFNASLSNSIYGSSSTVQPPALTCLICIKY